ncbi:flagellar operon protein (TIGR03826 family) [Caldalkalibacillus uzonensis]|uniref:Flagellar operon protein (TIGR03826 family) n=1 Tax=Caldalkalibacillus uzonensis TaxID=353224 RepID=A0ABU0CUU9_9BACI|nr:TIGR03826 family flagellar region protein [Caldalkalibacillus uzonensis]MDQ0339897.1 flagellar operon protein (TIGR03826 family) [Caldalkalibacillus uzonensis]
MAQLENCPRCGTLFVRTVRKVCPQCHQEIEQQYRIVYDFLRRKENREATIYETSEQTGVSVAQIKEFIRQGRLQLKDLPNMGYPCESCGTLIQEGRLCKSCRERLISEMGKLNASEGENSTPSHSRDYKHAKGYRQLKADDKQRRGR